MRFPESLKETKESPKGAGLCFSVILGGFFCVFAPFTIVDFRFIAVAFLEFTFSTVREYMELRSKGDE